MISSATDAILTIDNAKGNSVTDILNSIVDHQISLNDAAAQLGTLIASSGPMQKLDGAFQGQFSGRPISLPGFRKKATRWTPEEDERLIAAIREHGTENWPLIAQQIGGGRTRAQCSQRWNRGLDPRINKRNWSQEEERELLRAVELHGSKAWTRIATELGDRSDVQCRFRYRFLCKKAKEAGTPVQPISPPKGTGPTMGRNEGEPLLIPPECQDGR
jgi:hypothetical protein